MAGIVAMMCERGALRADVLDRATRTLGHRGPDERHHWIDATRSVGLGHTRLATVDLSGGQPVASEDGSIRAVVDGELYDTERLRGELIARGHRFASASASELIVHLYEDHGEALVEHLRGEFAFVLHDGRRDLVIAARDRCGVKPLVYAEHGGALIIASEVKALLAAGLPAAWDRDGFLRSCIGESLDGSTLFAGARRVPAGHLLIAGRGHHRLVGYWDFDYPVDGSAPVRPEAEDREALAGVLAEAVRLRLRGDVPVACYLSGLDASTVLGFAQRVAPAPLRAFTLTLGDTMTEENALAHEAALRAGAAPTVIPVRPGALASDLGDVVYFAERPVHHIGAAVLYQLARAVRAAGINAVLTGEGSDELFAGYPHFRRDLAGPAASPPRIAGALRPGPRLSLAPIQTALGAVPHWLQLQAAKLGGLLGLLRSELAARLVSGEPLASSVAGLPIASQLHGRHPVHQAMYLWSKWQLPGDALAVRSDAIQMAHGVACRLPFLDHRVIELSTRLPIDRLIRGDVEKYLLREAARPVITEAQYRRPKDRLGAPHVTAIESAVVDTLVQDTLRGPLVAASPFFDPARIRMALDALPTLDRNARQVLHGPLMLAATLCLMQQRFGLADAV